jgi:hypothetical protein
MPGTTEADGAHVSPASVDLKMRYWAATNTVGGFDGSTATARASAADGPPVLQAPWPTVALQAAPPRQEKRGRTY